MKIWEKIVGESMNGLGIAGLLGLTTPPAADEGVHPGSSA